MMARCDRCGAHVRVSSGGGTGGLFLAMAMVVLAAIGGVLVYRSMHGSTSRDSAAIGSHIGEIGQ